MTVTIRLVFADGHAELVEQDRENLRRLWFVHHVNEVAEHGRMRTIPFERRVYLYPPDFVGPLPSDDVEVEHDPPWRQDMERDLGVEATYLSLGPRHEGWRRVTMYHEATR
jgi:hypothetical protein